MEYSTHHSTVIIQGEKPGFYKKPGILASAILFEDFKISAYHAPIGHLQNTF